MNIFTIYELPQSDLTKTEEDFFQVYSEVLRNKKKKPLKKNKNKSWNFK